MLQNISYYCLLLPTTIGMEWPPQNSYTVRVLPLSLLSLQQNCIISRTDLLKKISSHVPGDFLTCAKAMY